MIAWARWALRILSWEVCPLWGASRLLHPGHSWARCAESSLVMRMLAMNLMSFHEQVL